MGTRLLIVTALDVGFCEATTRASAAVLKAGVASDARVIVPGPWSHYAAACLSGFDIGIELSLLAHGPIIHLGPLTASPSLLGGQGGFPETPEDLFEHADLEEVHHELRTQIERLSEWGCRLSHLGVSSDILLARAELFGAVLDLSREFALPIRIDHKMREETLGYDAYRLAAEAKCVVTEHALDLGTQHYSSQEAFEEGFRNAVIGCAPDEVIDVGILFAYDTPESRALYSEQVEVAQLLVEDPNILRDLTASLGCTLTSYSKQTRATR